MRCPRPLTGLGDQGQRSIEPAGGLRLAVGGFGVGEAHANAASNARAPSATGARIVGVDSELRDVLEIAPEPKVSSGGGAGHTSSTGTETISLSTAEGLPIVAGRLLALGAALVLIAELVLVAAHDVRAWRARAAGRPTA